MSNILCTICARGGSKGVKNKNIKELNGKPLIAYTIEQAKDSNLFEHIVISTDSDDIAKTLQYIKSLDNIGWAKLQILYQLMVILYHTGRINKFGWDLHTGNVMKRKDGTMVITDPWFSYMGSR